jgi:hypothetical protein
MSFIIGTVAYDLGVFAAVRSFFSNIWNYLKPRIEAYGTQRAKAELARHGLERYLVHFNGAN